MPAKPDLIVFLCPNGHRLNGPSSLEGKPGQCPHCGVKFRVPSRDDPPDEDDSHSPVVVQPGSGSNIDKLETVEEVTEEATLSFNIDQAEKGSSASRIPYVPSGSSPSQLARERHPLGEIFVKLWEERDRGSVVELHLSSGVTITPEWYSKDLSRRTYGLFAIRDPDGTFTVTAVNWDAVARINVRHLSKLPKKVFEQ